MRGQTLTTRGKKLALRRRVSQATIPENYIGKDKGSGDWACPRESQLARTIACALSVVSTSSG